MSANHGASVSDDSRRAQVRERYSDIAAHASCCGASGSAVSSCGDGDSSCCGSGNSGGAIQLGYTPKQLASLPEGSNLGLGCGNPTAILGLRSAQTVLDLGSGAGIDCFLAAKKVGPKGSVIGVDMTPEMVTKARGNARKGRYRNVEFRLGEIEHLPVSDGSVDVVLSNCVINLAPDKGRVYREAFRVLRPGGKLAISDVVATRPITDTERADPSLWSSCSSGALEVRTVKLLLTRAGFIDVRVNLPPFTATPASLEGQASLGVVSAEITATKPTV
ncbi:MAG: arsenite methyltransferase [Thermoplasmata archaeon]|nr:arsenite methyltransferase [Thermoplasmata archaeon]